MENLENIPDKFKSEVAFIGIFIKDEKRDTFLLALNSAGISIKIWGPRWHKSNHWEELKQIYQGSFLSGKDYQYAIRGSKICLGFISKGN